MKRIFLILLVLSVPMFSGCEQQVSKEDYFPLQEGLSWQYRVTENLLDEEHRRSFSIENLGSVSLKGDYEDLPVSVRRTSDDTDYYIVQDDTGSHRIATRTVIEFKPRFDSEERTILPPKSSWGSGVAWHVESIPYVLHTTRNQSMPDPKKRRFVLTYEILDTDSEVIVPAGIFKNSLKIRGRGVVSFYADPMKGYQDVNVVQTEWYAPGVGLVKLVREEPMDLKFFKGGSITFELERFER